MTDFWNHGPKEGMVRGIYTGSNWLYSYSPEVSISGELSHSSFITTQSNGKGGVKGEKMNGSAFSCY